MYKLIILIGVFTCGCSGEITTNQDLVSYTDKDRNVVCYRISGYRGISCVKLDK